jgi:hypothetical protein
MPYLGREFVEDLCANYSAMLRGEALDVERIFPMFEKTGKRLAILTSSIASSLIWNAEKMYSDRAGSACN